MLIPAYDGGMRAADELGTTAHRGGKAAVRPGRLLRWATWVALGLLAGLVVGFGLGLARPQVER